MWAVHYAHKLINKNKDITAQLHQPRFFSRYPETLHEITPSQSKEFSEANIIQKFCQSQAIIHIDTKSHTIQRAEDRYLPDGLPTEDNQRLKITKADWHKLTV